MKIFDKFLELLGIYIAILALIIALLGIAWQSIKPVVEKEELQYIKIMKGLEDGNITQ